MCDIMMFSFLLVFGGLVSILLPSLLPLAAACSCFDSNASPSNDVVDFVPRAQFDLDAIVFSFSDFSNSTSALFCSSASHDDVNEWLFEKNQNLFFLLSVSPTDVAPEPELCTCDEKNVFFSSRV
jgi:hypothetical protein